jgi:hypothetical protein
LIRVVLVVAAVAALLLLLRVVLAGSAPRHSGPRPEELSRYARHLLEALADGGRVEVGCRQLGRAVVLEKRTGGGSPPRLVLHLRRAAFGRRWLVRAAVLLSDAGIPHTVERSRRLRRLNEITVPVDASAPRAVSDGATPAGDVLVALGVSPGARLTLTCRGPLRPGFEVEDGDVLPHPLSYRLGVGIGRALGAITHALRDRER